MFIGFRQLILMHIHKEIGLNKNLVIDPVNICVSVMVCNQILDSCRNICIESQPFQHFPGNARILLFLQFAVAIAGAINFE